MCKNCSDIIHSMGITDADLPYLPYTATKWACVFSNCNNSCVVRDYGVQPFYYWPVKIKNRRGGWIDSSIHYYMCSKHWKLVKARKIDIMPDRSPEILISKFTRATKV